MAIQVFKFYYRTVAHGDSSWREKPMIMLKGEGLKEAWDKFWNWANRNRYGNKILYRLTKLENGMEIEIPFREIFPDYERA